MFLIWRGWGLLLPLGAGFGALMGMLAASLLVTTAVSDMMPAVVAIGACLGAYGVVRLLEGTDKGRAVIDKKTGQEILLVRGDSLFFIKVRYWFYLLVLIAIAFFVFGIVHMITG
ncbi:hypothetical protein [Roseibium suaedae]|uniref:Uncharacterized protein n=1 Tax=Roseibium suaedae TaxID=735517 RepID=A0A1M7ALS2_9HYPH|nr:hypothetical protein [Roseibium suaedae]SHL43704.1 hypothetical protein SAMN05444272_0586 [Roseibium suaedae]